MKDLKLYIHIPFCKSKCYYCDFCSTSSKKYISSYLNELINESNDISTRLNDYVVKSIFIGGGTPTILENGQLSDTFYKIIKNFNIDLEEFTVEANPDTITICKLNELKSMGVNRISIGVQTLNDNILKLLNRTHNSAVAIDSIRLCKQYFDNISVDLMIGLPTQTIADIEYVINTICELGVNHISCYTLQIEENTVLKKQIQDGKISVPDDDKTADMYNFAYNLLKKRGFNRYEISNFAKDNKISKHNYGYWTRKNYLGLGVTAYSLIDNIRFNNVSSIKEYIANRRYVDIEKLSIKEQMFEEIMLGFRTKKGINIANFNEKYKTDFIKLYKKQIEKMQNYLKFYDNYLSIKEEFFEVSNSIILEFMD